MEVFDLQYSIKEKYFFELYHTIKRNQIVSQSELDGATTVIMPINYQYESFGSSVNIPVRFTPWWKSVHKATLSHSNTQGFYLEEKFDNDFIEFDVFAQHEFRLTSDFNATITARYYSPYYLGISKISFDPYLDVNINKSFLDSRLKVTLDFLDVFRTALKTAQTSFFDQESWFERRDDTHRMSLGLNYTLFKGERKNDRTNDILQEEKSRLGN